MSYLSRRYAALEARNDHNEAALLLVKNFGTEEEVAIIEGITQRTERRGYISQDDYALRFRTSNKYYPLIKTGK